MDAPTRVATRSRGRMILDSASQYWSLVAILIVFGLTCVLYGATVPLGEPPDELAHYQYVRYLDAVGHPPLTAADRLSSGYKGHEPPLYYVLVHGVGRFLNFAQRPMLKLIDPDLYPRHSIPGEAMLWNAVLHTAEENWPWHGTSLAWHFLRLLSIPLAMVTIVCTYAIARRLVPTHPEVALVAAGLNAFNPQFVYVSSALNNDNLAVPLTAVALWLMVCMAQGELSWRRFALLGVVIGLARITKFYTLLLLPVLVLVLTIIAWRLRRWKRCLLGSLLVLALVLAVSAPWVMAVQPDNPEIAPQGVVGFVAKMLDIVHTDRLLRSEGMAAGGDSGLMASFGNMVVSFFRLEPARWAELLFKSFWAYYGPMTIEAKQWLYVAMGLLCGIAGVGIVRTVVRFWLQRRQSSSPGRAVPWSVLLIQVAAVMLLEALFYTIMRRLPDTAQGRHLYTAMPAWAQALSGGLLSWVPRRVRPGFSAMLLAAMIGLCLYSLPTFVLSAYDPLLPVRRTLVRAWEPATPAFVQAAPGIDYLGSTWKESDCEPGQALQVTLLWQAQAEILDEYMLQIHFRDIEGDEYLLHLSQPAGGRMPTRSWDPGDYIRDVHQISVPQGMANAKYLVSAQWVSPDLDPVGPELDLGACNVTVSPDSRPFTTIEVSSDDERGQPTSQATYRDVVMVTWLRMAYESQVPKMVSAQGLEWSPARIDVLPGQQSGELGRAFFVVDGRVASDTYTLRFGSERSDLACVVDVARPRAFAISEDIVNVNATLGDGVVLVGYRYEGVEARPSGLPVLRAGQTMTLTLVWKADRWINQSYTVFTHLVDQQGQTIAQHDQVPQFQNATLFWEPGQVVVDWYYLSVPENAVSGSYEVRVGMYSKPSGERLPAEIDGLAVGSFIALSQRVVVEP